MITAEKLLEKGFQEGEHLKTIYFKDLNDNCYIAFDFNAKELSLVITNGVNEIGEDYEEFFTVIHNPSMDKVNALLSVFV